MEKSIKPIIFKAMERVFYNGVDCMVTVGISPRATEVQLDSLTDDYPVSVCPMNMSDRISKKVGYGMSVRTSSNDPLLVKRSDVYPD